MKASVLASPPQRSRLLGRGDSAVPDRLDECGVIAGVLVGVLERPPLDHGVEPVRRPEIP